MPEKILALLEQKSLTEWQIAENLSISVEEVKAIIDYLQQMGYIKSTFINPTGAGCDSCGGNCSGGCAGNCKNCNTSSNTISNSSYTIWELL